MRYKLKPSFLMFDGNDLETKKLFLADVETHNTYILEGDTREGFCEVLNNSPDAEMFYEVFAEYGFFETV